MNADVKGESFVVVKEWCYPTPFATPQGAQVLLDSVRRALKPNGAKELTSLIICNPQGYIAYAKYAFVDER